MMEEVRARQDTNVESLGMAAPWDGFSVVQHASACSAVQDYVDTVSRLFADCDKDNSGAECRVQSAGCRKSVGTIFRPNNSTACTLHLCSLLSLSETNI